MAGEHGHASGVRRGGIGQDAMDVDVASGNTSGFRIGSTEAHMDGKPGRDDAFGNEPTPQINAINDRPRFAMHVSLPADDDMGGSIPHTSDTKPKKRQQRKKTPANL